MSDHTTKLRAEIIARLVTLTDSKKCSPYETAHTFLKAFDSFLLYLNHEAAKEIHRHPINSLQHYEAIEGHIEIVNLQKEVATFLHDNLLDPKTIIEHAADTWADNQPKCSTKDHSQ